MPTLEELEKRLKVLEAMFFDNVDLNENGNITFKTTFKYICFSKDEKFILSYNGFKPINHNKDYTIRLFNSPANCKDFINEHKLYSKIEVKIKRVKVSYELFNKEE